MKTFVLRRTKTTVERGFLLYLFVTEDIYRDATIIVRYVPADMYGRRLVINKETKFNVELYRVMRDCRVIVCCLSTGYDGWGRLTTDSGFCMFKIRGGDIWAAEMLERIEQSRYHICTIKYPH